MNSKAAAPRRPVFVPFLRIADKIVDSSLGPGSVAKFTSSGFPVVRGSDKTAPVGWLETEAGEVWDPFGERELYLKSRREQQEYEKASTTKAKTPQQKPLGQVAYETWWSFRNLAPPTRWENLLDSDRRMWSSLAKKVVEAALSANVSQARDAEAAIASAADKLEQILKTSF